MNEVLDNICCKIKERDIINHTLNKEDMVKYTQSDFRNDMNTIRDIMFASGRKWKMNLQNAALLIDYFKNMSDYSVIGISSNNSDLIEIFGSHQNVSKVIDYCIKIDLLKCVKYDYSYISCYTNLNSVKEYILNPVVKKIIEENITLNSKYNNKRKNPSTTHKCNYSKQVIKNEEVMKVLNKLDISSDLGIKTPLSNEHISYLFFEKEPLLRETKELIDYENEKYLKDPELKRRWRLKITRNKKGTITKIGIRDTSIMSNYRAHFNTDKEREQYNKESKENYLDRKFGKGNWVEYDVKSSIYRITYFLNHKRWLEDDVDMYEMIYNDKFESKEERDKFKGFCMPLYFGKDDIDEMWKDMKYSSGIETDRDDFKEIITMYRQNMNNTIGKRYGSKIFLYESRIYAELAKNLMDMGYDVVQIYDGFYTTGISHEDFKRLCFEELIKITDKMK